MKLLLGLILLVVPSFGGFSPYRGGSEIVRNTYYLRKYGTPEFSKREKLDGLFDFFGKIHGSKQSREEALDSIRLAGEKILTNPLEFADDGNLWSCVKSWNKVLYHQSVGTIFAVTMLDSWGYAEGGWWEGNVRWAGHYYECKDSKYEEDERLNGKYCTAYWGYRYIPDMMGVPVDIAAGICVPQNCSAQSVLTLLRISNAHFQDFPPLLEVECAKPPPEKYSTGDIIGIIIGSFLFVFLVLGTLVDFYGRITKRNEQNHGLPKKMALCFSVISNAEKLVDMKKRPGVVPVLDGMRFITTTWVIFGHSLNFMIFYLDNSVRMNQMVRNWSLMPIANAIYAVDTFFFLSGLLVAYLGMKEITKNKGWLNVPLMYLQRYLRLTPAYAFAILFSVGLYRYVGIGPRWQDVADNYNDQCKNDWWTNLLYISTLYPVEMKCFGIGWYLSNDMMFYILAPIFLFILYRNRWVGLALLWTFTVASALVTGLLSYYHEIQTSTIGLMIGASFWGRFFVSTDPEPLTYDTKMKYDVYYTPWCRYSVYLIGMMTGWILYEFKLKIKMHKVFVFIGWCSSLATASAIIYGVYPYVEDLTVMSDKLTGFYQGAARPAWGLVMAWIVIACSSGYGGPITKILDFPVFTPLSRLTYSSYLCHFMVLDWYLGSQEGTLHYLTMNMVYIYMGTMIISFGCGTILAFGVEFPFGNLVKLAFSSKRHSVVKPASSEIGQKTSLENGNVEHDDVHPEKKLPPYSMTDMKMSTENGYAIHQNGGFVPDVKENGHQDFVSEEKSSSESVATAF